MLLLNGPARKKRMREEVERSALPTGRGEGVLLWMGESRAALL